VTSFAPPGTSFEAAFAAPCISSSLRHGDKVGVAAADGSPSAPWVSKPFLSLAPHPSILISRTVAGAASRARMRKDGR